MTSEPYDEEREQENKESVYIECETCEGLGGWDIADNCEIYDEWQECKVCEGTGEVLL